MRYFIALLVACLVPVSALLGSACFGLYLDGVEEAALLIPFCVAVALLSVIAAGVIATGGRKHDRHF